MLFKTSFVVLKTIIDAGSFTQAARQLGISSAAVGKHVQRLENQLNMRLFHRTTRRVTPTENALKLNAVIRQSEEYFEQTLELLSSENATPSGRLRLNVPILFGDMFLAEPIAQFAKKYPQVMIDVDFDDKQVHLIEEGVDLVVRIGMLEDSGLIAQKIMDFPIILCASPDLLTGRPALEEPEDLEGWPMICYSYLSYPTHWTYLDANQHKRTVHLSPAMYTNNSSMLKQACLSGKGVAILPQLFCQQELSAGQLIQLFPDYPADSSRAVYALYPEKQFVPLKVKLFIDILHKLAPTLLREKKEPS